MKEMLTSEQLIEHMKNKGITFNLCSEEEAKIFLENNNYYFKLASYRENFDKFTSGKKTGQYQHLDFAYLIELSTIDMYLRNLVILMSLDIEHFLKVRLINKLENIPNDDGYRLVQKFLAQNKDFSVFKKINSHKSSEYCKALIDKYYPYFPTWVFVELISFGDLAHLCSFYQEEYNDTIVNAGLLNSVRDIRNASAHNNCLINNLKKETDSIPGFISNKVSPISSISDRSRKRWLKNKFMCDFASLLFVYDEIVGSTAMKNKRKKELDKLFNGRMLDHKDWFSTNTRLKGAYMFLKNLVDNFNWQ